MRNIFIIVLSGICMTSVFSQSLVRFPPRPIFSSVGALVYQQLSSFGLTEALTDFSTLSSVNPMHIANYSRPEVGLAYQFDLEDELRSDPFTDRGLAGLPQEFTLIYPFKSVVLMTGFHQRLNHRFGPFKIPLGTISDPGGTGELVKVVQNDAVLTAVAGFGARSRRFAGDAGKWSFGLRFNANYFRIRDEFGSLKGSADDMFPSLHAGLGYQLGEENRPLFSISIFGDLNPEFTYSNRADVRSVVTRRDSLTGEIIADVTTITQEFEGRMPDRFGISLLLQPGKRVSIYADINMLRLSKIKNSSLTNRFDLGIGSALWLTEQLHISSGISRSSLSIEVSWPGEEDISLSNMLLSHGLGIKRGKWGGNLSVLYSVNSDFFTRDRFMLKSGISMEL